MSRERYVFVVDSDESIRSSLRILLTAHGCRVQSFETPTMFFAHREDVELGTVIVSYEFGLHEMNGVEVLRKLREDHLLYPVVIVTGYPQTAVAVNAMKSGVVDFLEKPYSETALLAAVDSAFEIAEVAVAREKEMSVIRTRLELLDDDERDVLDCLLHGLANKQIALRRDIAVRTVERRRRSILEKLEVDTVQEAAILVTKAKQ